MVKLERFTPFAIFKNSGELKYRTETYLSLTNKEEEFIKSLKEEKCIGVVIMLNPGSSDHKEEKYDELVEATADPTMKKIEECVLKAYEDSLPDEGYIEIFNLFNLCEPNPKEALKKYKRYKDNPPKIGLSLRHHGFGLLGAVMMIQNYTHSHN